MVLDPASYCLCRRTNGFANDFLVAQQLDFNNFGLLLCDALVIWKESAIVLGFCIEVHEFFEYLWVLVLHDPAVHLPIFLDDGPSDKDWVVACIEKSRPSQYGSLSIHPDQVRNHPIMISQFVGPERPIQKHSINIVDFFARWTYIHFTPLCKFDRLIL